ncbi:MAG TPA: FAD-dependent oxidoreductase [Ktedonobacterales bacterium]
MGDNNAMTPQLANQDYDVVIIGAGLGGLLSAAQCLQRGMRVAVLERLAHCGGRFTAKTFQGAQISTGAVHMLPFGSNGVLAGMLRRLAVPHYVYDAEVFASFFVHGRQHVCRSLLGVASFLGPRQFTRFVLLGPTLMARRLPADERDLPFTDWLKKYHVTPTSSPELYAFFERISHFALSVPLEEISALEVAETTKNMFRYGPPGIVEGGCAAVTGELERRVREQGGEVRLRHDVVRVLTEEGAVTGVHARDKATGEESILHAPLVISNVGPRATARMAQGVVEHSAPIREAVGLKVHVLSDRSLIPHKGIMYCLDTERIAGMVQPSNCDRRLAPPGKHLLITHQVMRSDDVEQERALAVADLRRIIGPDFERDCRVLTISQYRGEWPVNRAQQGADFAPEIGLRGLYLVGDAIKPSGYLMVEGVAQSVNQMLDLLDDLDRGGTAPATKMEPAAAARSERRSGASHIPRKPGAARALYWLVAPPPPARQKHLPTRSEPQ